MISTMEVLVLGVFEGFMEFLPVSSTGHLILLSQLLGLEQNDAHKAFEVIIQLGAILAVVVSFFKELLDFKLLTKLAVAFVPTGVAGLLLYDFIKSLFDSGVVAYMLIIGGVILIALDLYFKPKATTKCVQEVSYMQAFVIGCAQILAMIPGTSRSAATIVGGLGMGLDKLSAAKFSFFLAVPTMIVASAYDVYKNYDLFVDLDYIWPIVLGFAISFVSALVAIRFFLGLVRRVGFWVFGVYRILVGGAFLLLA